MKLSVVSTLFCSASGLNEFYERASSAARNLVGDDYEIVFVNDGSPDRSLEIVVELARRDSHLVVVDLSRNFGHHKAMMTGLTYATGSILFLIDSDLEEAPEWLQVFSQQMQLHSCDVVYGVQERRKGPWFERWSGQAFYYLFKLLTGLALPKNIVTARLMTRTYVDALLQHREREIYIAGLWHITGFDQYPQTVKKTSISPSTYTLRSKMSMLVNSLTSFTNAPLVIIFYIGGLISTVAVLYIIYLVVRWGTLEQPVSGWTSVMASIWL